jgi:hypothetical protein
MLEPGNTDNCNELFVGATCQYSTIVHALSTKKPRAVSAAAGGCNETFGTVTGAKKFLVDAPAHIRRKAGPVLSVVSFLKWGGAPLHVQASSGIPGFVGS